MRNLSRLIFLLFFFAVAGIVLFLATWDIPAPIVETEKLIPNDRFPR